MNDTPDVVLDGEILQPDDANRDVLQALSILQRSSTGREIFKNASQCKSDAIKLFDPTFVKGRDYDSAEKHAVLLASVLIVWTSMKEGKKSLASFR